MPTAHELDLRLEPADWLERTFERLGSDDLSSSMELFRLEREMVRGYSVTLLTETDDS